MQKILITGANGFVGQNAAADLAARPEGYSLMTADVGTDEAALREFLSECDFVLHFAGVNRPSHEGEFETGNAEFTAWLCDTLMASDNPPPLLLTSSIQSDLDNPYGRSKRRAEAAVLNYGRLSGAPVYVFKLPNLFGKWSRPNYNSVVATFCHNIINGLPIRIDDPARELTLLYIDDLLEIIRAALRGDISPEPDGYCGIDKRITFTLTVGQLADRIAALADNRKSLLMPELSRLDRALCAVCLGFLPPDDFSYPLTEHRDTRGSFYEIFKADSAGQFSVSTTAPGVTRGNHWHHTKTEKFIVVSGRASIRFRRVGGDEVIEYTVSGERPEAVDIPPGYTHSISNISDTETLITVIWASELFDPECPDTFYMDV